MAGKLPFMQFFPDAWLSDLALRSVTPAARGVWMDMLCLMWGSPRRGHLCHRSGLPLTLEQLARTTGCSTAEAASIVEELITCGVCSRSGDGVLFSRRMVRDEERRETNRTNGKKGGNPSLVAQSDNRPDNPPVNRRDNRTANPPVKPRSQKSEVRSQSPDPEENTPPPPTGGGSTTSPRRERVVFDPLGIEFPPEMLQEGFPEAWRRWVDYRQGFTPKLKPASWRAQADAFVRYGPLAGVTAIDQSIANGYRGVFPDKCAVGRQLGFRQSDLTFQGLRDFVAAGGDSDEPS